MIRPIVSRTPDITVADELTGGILPCGPSNSFIHCPFSITWKTSSKNWRKGPPASIAIPLLIVRGLVALYSRPLKYRNAALNASWSDEMVIILAGPVNFVPSAESMMPRESRCRKSSVASSRFPL